MKLKKFITVVAMTAMVGTLAVGCGKSDSKDNGSDKKSESSWVIKRYHNLIQRRWLRNERSIH